MSGGVECIALFMCFSCEIKLARNIRFHIALPSRSPASLMASARMAASIAFHLTPFLSLVRHHLLSGFVACFHFCARLSTEADFLCERTALFGVVW